MLGNLAAWVTGALDGVFEYTPNDPDFESNGLIDLQCGRTVFNDVPSKMRTELWASQLHKHSGSGSAAVVKYSSLAASPLNPDVIAEIEKDTHRTFPGHMWLSGRAGQLAMLRVLRAYAVFDPEVGYTQGMNFLAGLFLAYLDEAQAFGALVLVMKDRGLRALYLPNDGMALLQVRLWQLGRLMPPRLSTHLENHAALPVLYASSWFLTCFSADFPMHFAARVMDLVVTDCYAAPLMKVAVHILERCEAELLEMEDIEQMVDLLRKEVPKWSRGKLQDLLTEALGRAWTSRQSEVLKEINGAESVAEAVARVDLALAAGAATKEAHDEATVRDQVEHPSSSLNNNKNKPAAPASSCSSPITEGKTIFPEGKSPSSPSTTSNVPLPSSQSQIPATAGTESSPSTPNKITLPQLPPPPTSRNDKVQWSQWRPSTPVLKTMHTDNIKIQTEINEVSLDPVLSHELSSYIGKNDGAAMCTLPFSSPAVTENEEKESQDQAEESLHIEKVSTEMRVHIGSPRFPQGGTNNARGSAANPSLIAATSPSFGGVGSSGGSKDKEAAMQIPSPFETRSHASGSMGTHSDIGNSLSTGEFSDFTGATGDGGAATKEAGGGSGKNEKDEAGATSWGQSAADSIAYLLGNFSMGYQEDSGVDAENNTEKTREGEEGRKNLAAQQLEALHPLESIAESPGFGTLPTPGMSGFGSWRVADHAPIGAGDNTTSPSVAVPTATQQDNTVTMMTASSSVQMSPANSKVMLLQQAHLKEFSASAKKDPKNRWT